jgi:hypothetical protein
MFLFIRFAKLLFPFFMLLLAMNVNAQIIIPTKLGKDFEKGFYHLPVKVVVKNMWKANDADRKEIIATIRDFGFRDSIILLTPPEYPNKAYRDSIDIISRNAKVASVIEITFKQYVTSWYNIAKSETNTITMNYKAYDAENARLILPGLIFGAGSFASIKKMFIKAVPAIL